MSTTPIDLDVHDLVRQLTEQHAHREPYDWQPEEGGTKYARHHATAVPALVLQLLASTPNVNGTGDLAGTQATSRPAARIEAMDTVMLIDEEAGEWIARLGGVTPGDKIDPETLLTIVGSGTVLRLQRLHGLYPATEVCERPTHRKDDKAAWCCLRGHLEHDVRRWWYQARIITGWDMAAWIPNNTCPVCDERRKLRIRLDSAMCVECRTVWPADQLGLLAEHIRTENREEDEVAEETQKTAS